MKTHERFAVVFLKEERKKIRRQLIGQHKTCGSCQVKLHFQATNRHNYKLWEMKIFCFSRFTSCWSSSSKHNRHSSTNWNHILLSRHFLFIIVHLSVPWKVDISGIVFFVFFFSVRTSFKGYCYPQVVKANNVLYMYNYMYISSSSKWVC